MTLFGQFGFRLFGGQYGCCCAQAGAPIAIDNHAIQIRFTSPPPERSHLTLANSSWHHRWPEGGRMKCAACNAENPADAKFCQACGVPLAMRRARVPAQQPG